MQTWRAISAMPLERRPDARRAFSLGSATLSMGPIAGPRTGQFRGRNPRVRAEVPRVAKDVAQSWSANAEGLYDIDVLAIAIDLADPMLLHAATDPTGILRSRNGDQIWSASPAPPAKRILALAVDLAKRTCTPARRRASSAVSTAGEASTQRACGGPTWHGPSHSTRAPIRPRCITGRGWRGQDNHRGSLVGRDRAGEAVDALSRFGLPCQRKGPQCLLVVRSWSVPQQPLLRS